MKPFWAPGFGLLEQVNKGFLGSMKSNNPGINPESNRQSAMQPFFLNGLGQDATAPSQQQLSAEQAARIAQGYGQAIAQMAKDSEGRGNYSMLAPDTHHINISDDLKNPKYVSINTRPDITARYNELFSGLENNALSHEQIHDLTRFMSAMTPDTRDALLTNLRNLKQENPALFAEEFKKISQAQQEAEKQIDDALYPDPARNQDAMDVDDDEAPIQSAARVMPRKPNFKNKPTHGGTHFCSLPILLTISAATGIGTFAAKEADAFTKSLLSELSKAYGARASDWATIQMVYNITAGIALTLLTSVNAAIHAKTEAVATHCREGGYLSEKDWQDIHHWNREAQHAKTGTRPSLAKPPAVKENRPKEDEDETPEVDRLVFDDQNPRR